MIFIVNPISGKGRSKRLANKLLANGYKVLFTEYAGHAEKLAREAID
jgi:diacylglycerol kinase family enzyme